MNYPVWQLEFAGGGLLIAMMAVIHVFISHFAVGGGLFLVVIWVPIRYSRLLKESLSCQDPAEGRRLETL